MSGNRFYWGLFGATMLLYAVMLVWSVPVLVTGADGLWPFDTHVLGYSHAAATAFLKALSDDARAFYLNVQQPLDTAFPAMLAAVFALTILRLSEYGKTINNALLIAPLLGAIFDYLENGAVSVMLRANTVSVEMADTASLWTQLKFAAILVSLITIVRLLVLHRQKSRRQT